MLEAALTAPTGDDVFREDPTVQLLEATVADLLGKPAAMYCPTGTMANLTAIAAHCDRRASEIITGASSHICLYESGNVSTAASAHSRQLKEHDCTAELDLDEVADAIRDTDTDEHFCKTALVCVENTHNVLGGIPLSDSYLEKLSSLCHGRGVAVHMDGARLAHAVAATSSSWSQIAGYCDTVSLCLSKGLGAPLGSVLVASDPEVLRLARRARKRYGGGMRQAGVVAAMGLYAVRHHADRVIEDHERARRLAEHLQQAGFIVAPGQPQTNILFFGLPIRENSDKSTTQQHQQLYLKRLTKDYGVKLTGGYQRGGNMFRAVTHLDIDDDDIKWAMHAMVDAWYRVEKEM